MIDDCDGQIFDVNSDAIPKIKEIPKWKKYLIIGGVIAVFIILLIIIMILMINSNPNSNEKNQDKKEEEGKEEKDEPEREVIGQIICKYEISNNKNPTKILGDDFKNEGNFGIYIAEKKINYTKEYTFDEIGSVNVVFEIYDTINMDYR